MATLTSPTARTPEIAVQLESFFETHTVTAEKIEDRYGDDSEAADWGVVCEDCGQAQDFFLTPNNGELDVSDVFIQSLEEQPCEPYTFPDVDTGEHSIVLHSEDPAKIGSERRIHCEDCGRTATVPSNDEYAGTDLERFGAFPCAETYTDKELGGAVLFPSIDTYPDKHEVGIENWVNSGSHGWGKDIGSFWYHPNFPVSIVLSRKFGERAIKLNVVKGSMRRNPGGIRNETLSVTQYQEHKNADINFDVPKRTLRFMQAVNDYDGDADDFEEIRNSIDTDIISYYTESHDLQTETPNPPEKPSH